MNCTVMTSPLKCKHSWTTWLEGNGSIYTDVHFFFLGEAAASPGQRGWKGMAAHTLPMKVFENAGIFGETNRVFRI